MDGVPTQTRERSASRTRSVPAGSTVSLPPATARPTASSSPGSRTALFPLRIASTLAGFGSIPITSWPSSIAQAAVTVPTYPSPHTRTRMCLLLRAISVTRLQSRVLGLVARLSGQTGDDRAELPGRCTGYPDHLFHGYCHPRPEALEDTPANLVLVARAETVRWNDTDAYPVQCFLHDLAFADIRLVHEDTVEADHLAAVRADDHILDPADDFFENGHRATA